MLQKLVIYIQFFVIIVISIMGPILFFKSEDKDFVFANKAEADAIIQSIIEIDSLNTSYVTEFEVENEKIQDTISTYAFYYPLDIADTLKILYKVSDPSEFRYKEKFDYFLSSPLYFFLQKI